MIKFSKFVDYGVVILSSMGMSDDSCVSASVLANRTMIPEPTVAKVMKMLAKEGLVSSTRGMRGGYYLDVDLRDISIASVAQAIDGPIALVACVDEGEDVCSLEKFCMVKGRWKGVNIAVKTALESVSLADMLELEIKEEKSVSLEAIEGRA